MLVVMRKDATADQIRGVAEAIERSAGARVWLVFSHGEEGRSEALLGALARRGWRDLARVQAEGAFAAGMER